MLLRVLAIFPLLIESRTGKRNYVEGSRKKVFFSNFIHNHYPPKSMACRSCIVCSKKKKRQNRQNKSNKKKKKIKKLLVEKPKKKAQDRGSFSPTTNVITSIKQWIATPFPSPFLPPSLVPSFPLHSSTNTMIIGRRHRQCH